MRILTGIFQDDPLDADVVPSELLCPPSPTIVELTGPGGAVVDDFGVSATDDSGEAPALGCSPAAGTEFPLGDTEVNCTATDAAGKRGQLFVPCPGRRHDPAGVDVSRWAPGGGVCRSGWNARGLRSHRDGLVRCGDRRLLAGVRQSLSP